MRERPSPSPPARCRIRVRRAAPPSRPDLGPISIRHPRDARTGGGATPRPCIGRMVPALPSSVRVRSLAASGHPARAKSGKERTIGARKPGASTTSTASETPAAGPAAISTANGPRAAGRRRPERPPRGEERGPGSSRKRGADGRIFRFTGPALPRLPDLVEDRFRRLSRPRPVRPVRRIRRPPSRDPARRPGARAGRRTDTAPRSPAAESPPGHPRHRARRGLTASFLESGAESRTESGRASRPGARSRQAGNRKRPASRPHRPEHLPRAAEPVLHPFRAIIGPCAGPIRPGLARRAGPAAMPASAGDSPSRGIGPSGAAARKRRVSSTRRVPGHRAPPPADERGAARTAARTGVDRGEDTVESPEPPRARGPARPSTRRPARAPRSWTSKDCSTRRTASPTARC